MQTRTTDEEKIEIVKRYLSGENAINIAPDYNISTVALLGLLHRRNIKIRSASQTSREYPIDETFFDNIDTQEKAYFLGILYADGYNNTDRNAVNLGLKENDKEILVKLNNLLQPAKPLQFVNMKSNRKQEIKSSDQYRLVIANKHISKRLSELGCVKAKTFKIVFPEWLNKNLIQHFIRGYFDGDGCLSWSFPRKALQGCCSIVGTEQFCKSIKNHLLKFLKINCCISIRHPERKNNIRTLTIGGNCQIMAFLQYIYQNSCIHLNRKYVKYELFVKKFQELNKNKRNNTKFGNAGFNIALKSSRTDQLHVDRDACKRSTVALKKAMA